MICQRSLSCSSMTWYCKEKPLVWSADEVTDSSKNYLQLMYIKFIDADYLFCFSAKSHCQSHCGQTVQSETLTWKWPIWNGRSKGMSQMGLRHWLQSKVGCKCKSQKWISPIVQWTHCMMHWETLASKQLSPELNDVNDIIAIVNYVETQPIKDQIFSTLCEEMGSGHTTVLHHSTAQWLSWEKVLSMIFELQHEICFFSKEERPQV